MQDRYFPTHQDLRDSFPWQIHPEMRPNQRTMLEITAQERRSLVFEGPVGTGKSAGGLAFLEAFRRRGEGATFYLAPTKTVVEQIMAIYGNPNMRVAYGRSEHDCYYYPDQNLKADQIPCLLLRDCPHRVNQQTGETYVPGARRCRYYLQKYEAKEEGVTVICTVAFRLFTGFLGHEWQQPAVAMVVDEAHDVAEAVRSVLSFEISDWHLSRAVRLLQEFAPEQGEILNEFLQVMIRIIRSKPSDARTILEVEEVRELMNILMRLTPAVIETQVSAAIALGQIDPDRERLVLNQIQVLIRDLTRYLRSFNYSLETENRHALNYICAYWESEPGERTRIRNKLVISINYVAPIVRRMLAPNYIAYSATIRDAEAFSWDTGINAPVHYLPSEFPAENVRVFQPTDTPDLTFRLRDRREPRRILRRTARVCRQLQNDGQRFLMVVVSESERADFLRICNEEGVEILSYGNGVPAREVATRFRNGEASGLLGTEANYAQGLDLPGRTAPYIFALRPGYPSPQDPRSEFERRRFGNRVWRVWRWRAIIRTLQLRGRNIRSATDRGVTFLLSRQYRSFMPGALPEEIRPSYRSNQNFEECLQEARELIDTPSV